MKKIILALGLVLTFAGVSFAQTAPAKTEKKAKATTEKVATTAPATTSATHVKKDGTADKRYKENKNGGAKPQATTHLKKDGTADKRFKENKAK